MDMTERVTPQNDENGSYQINDGSDVDDVGHRAEKFANYQEQKSGASPVDLRNSLLIGSVSRIVVRGGGTRDWTRGHGTG